MQYVCVCVCVVEWSGVERGWLLQANCLLSFPAAKKLAYIRGIKHGMHGLEFDVRAMDLYGH